MLFVLKTAPACGAPSDARVCVRRATTNGMIAIHHACLKRHVEVVKWLHEHGQSLDAVDESGRSLLHLAVAANSPAMVQYLLEAGGDPKRLDGKSISPVDLAGRLDATAPLIHELLKNATSVPDAPAPPEAVATSPASVDLKWEPLSTP